VSSDAPDPPEDPTPPEDPFARWAHRRDPDLDLPPPADAKPATPRLAPGASRYGWFVGLVVLLILAYISLNTFRTSGLGSGIREGALLPPFAVPALTGTLNGDANILPGSRPRGGHTPACAVRLTGALNFCRLAAGRPVVIAFAAVRDTDSIRQLDTMQRVSAQFPGVLFFGLFLRGNRGRARQLTVQHGWTFPIGWDRHADVAAVYGVKSLPVLVFGTRRRRSRGSVYSELGAGALTAHLRRLGG
jgi:hypothetical protein